MTEAEEKEFRRIVQDELLGIIGDARAAIGLKDPTGFGKKALDGLAFIIRQRQSSAGQDKKTQ
jgi:hypothetical protein